MAKILIVDNNIDPPHGCADIRALLVRYGAEFGELHVEQRRGPDSATPDSGQGWDAVVLSGSKTRISENGPWIDKEINLLHALHREKVPTLGICYGEQLMARVFAGDRAAGAAETPEFGWTEIELLPAAKRSRVFHSLPERFYSFGFHSDEVYGGLPDKFSVVAKSRYCSVQAFDLLDAPMWGVQFHPERGLEEGNKSWDDREDHVPYTVILNRDKGAAVYSEGVAREIFRNFLKIVFAEAK